MSAKTKQKKPYDPGKETPIPGRRDEPRRSMEGCCCGRMSEEMRAACVSMMGRGCCPAEPPNTASE